MHRAKDRESLVLFPELFPLGGTLRQDNRWMKLAQLIPWENLDEMYLKHFSKDLGRPIKDSRLICGLLIVKHIDRESDERVVERFLESPYVQYLCGYEQFVTEDVIEASLLSKKRKRLGKGFFESFEKHLIEVLIERKILRAESHYLDATVVPANVEYPTDAKLLNRARAWTVKTIQVLRQRFNVQENVRTYCRVAKRAYLNFQKKRRKTRVEVRKMQGKMARYLRRNVKQLEGFLQEYGTRLKKTESSFVRRRLEVVKTIYAQQNTMWKTKTNTIKDRIVSLHLPRIRVMVRGKDGREVEFGPKVLLSWAGEFCFMDALKFEAYNEGGLLKESLEKYKERFGRYPKDSTGDGIFGTRANRELLKELKIRGGFKALGRAAKNTENRQWLRGKQRERGSLMEGIIGHAKTHYGLDRALYTIDGGEEIWTRMSLTAMNLMTALKIMNTMEAKAIQA